LLDEGLEVFKEANKGKKDNHQELVGRLYQQMYRRLRPALGSASCRWNSTGLKKNLVYDTNQKRTCIQVKHSSISIERQCELLGLARSSYYYEPCLENEENLTLMRLLDKQYLDTPYYGIRRMQWFLQQQGYRVNHKKVARLLQLMGLEAIYPKPNLSKRNLAHKIYPYLLRGIKIEQVNHVWSTDITYVPMAKGFMYLVAVMDGLAHPEHRRSAIPVSYFPGN
jgi:putative transposase